MWFANLLLIPQSTENFSPPELNGKLLLLRSSSKPRAASKVAPSAPQLLLPERSTDQTKRSPWCQSHRRNLPLLSSPWPAATQHSGTVDRHTLQKGESPTAWWVGGGTAAAAHSIMQRNPKQMGEQWKRHTEKSPPGMPPPPRPPQPPLVAEEATTSVCACVCVRLSGKREAQIAVECASQRFAASTLQ